MATGGCGGSDGNGGDRSSPPSSFSKTPGGSRLKQNRGPSSRSRNCGPSAGAGDSGGNRENVSGLIPSPIVNRISASSSHPLQNENVVDPINNFGATISNNLHIQPHINQPFAIQPLSAGLAVMAPFNNSSHPVNNSLPINQIRRSESAISCISSVSHYSSMDGEEDYRFVELSHPNHLLAGLNALRLSRLFCDVTLCVEGHEFPAHRIVLSSFSAYFRAMFGSEMAEKTQDRISINGVEPNMIAQIIQYAYTSEITITKSNVQSMLSASNLLQVIPIRDACCRFMLRHMDESNVIGIHCFAEAHACTDLMNKSKEYILSYFCDVSRQEEFLDLSQGKLIEIFSSNDVFSDCEELIFSAAVRWLDFDRSLRGPMFHLVLEHVRLPLVSPYFLHDCVDKQSIIRQNPACRDLLEEAVTYHLLPDRRHEMRNTRTRPRKASGLVEVIILVGGEDDKVVLRSVESFDPLTHAWKTLVCLPFAISKHGLVASGNNCMYLAGGEFPDGSASRSLWKFDPSYESWQELASMNVPRSELGLALLDGCIYAVGGWEGSHRLDSVECFNQVSNTWSMIANLKMAVTSPAVVAMDGMLYVTGGAVLEDGDGIDLVQCYDPKTNGWKEQQPMLIPRSGSAACSLNGKLYIIGGWHASTENTNKVECYDPVKDEWRSVASMNERRYRPGVAVIDGKIYVCGGEEGWDRYHDTIECYDTERDIWDLVGEMPSSRSWLSCVSLQIRKDFPPTTGSSNFHVRF